MAFVATATAVGGWALGTGVAAGIGSTIVGGALIGAGIGGAYSALTGDGNILNSMLTGGLIGGAGAGGLSAAGVGAAPVAGPAGAAPLSTVTAPSANVGTVTSSGLAAGTVAPATAAGAAAPLTLTGAGAAPVAGIGTVTTGVAPTVAGSSGMKALGYGLAGTTALSLLGNKQGGAGAGPMPDPGTIRPFDYSSTPNEATGTYPSPYATASYDASGNPIMDTRERNYFNQGFAALKPYSAKTGTANPNIPLPTSSSVNAAMGGIMGNYDDERGVDDVGLNQGNMQKGLFGLGYAHGGVARFADKGMVDEEAELRKTVMNNLKKLNPEQMKNVMSSFQGEGDLQKQFVTKNMPNYASSMAPSISSMVEGAQYGDRMAQASGRQPMDFNITPTKIDPERGFFGGTAQIGQNIDPQTRVSAMADIERTPYDRTVSDSVRKVGVGLDRQIGRDSNLSAFYEQDPMGRNKMGGARLTQRFENGGSVLLQGGPLQNQRFEQGGSVQNYGFGGLTLIEDMMRQAEQGQQAQIPKYNFDQNTQRYSVDNQPMMGAVPSFGGYSFDPNTDRYSTNPQPMAAGGLSLGGYSDGGRMLKGPGDGMSDDIPGVIGNKQPARLADGEFVVPADVVSHLGNGSTDAGAKRLYAMMDQVRKARTGNKKQGKQIKAQKYLPA
jgi:hypothetical protein